MLDYWKDRADEADDPEKAANWRAVQVEIERFAAGVTTFADLRSKLMPWTQDDPELRDLVENLHTLSLSPTRAERQKAQMTR